MSPDFNFNFRGIRIWFALTIALLVVGAIWDRIDQQGVKARQLAILNTLSDLTTKATARPQAHTACDTVKILQDLRAKGIDLPHYPVEERCPPMP